MLDEYWSAAPLWAQLLLLEHGPTATCSHHQHTLAQWLYCTHQHWCCYAPGLLHFLPPHIWLLNHTTYASTAGDVS